MCSSYRPVTLTEVLRTRWGVELPEGESPPDTFPLYLAPFIRLNKASQREAQRGHFGIVPHWAKELAIGKRAYNARSETVQEKPMFRDAWKWDQRCLVPAEFIYEPNYETGKYVPWRIGRRDREPFAIAGLWGHWIDPDSGEEVLSFTMLTLNADDHPLMKRFHKPQDEKRMVVILHKQDEDTWLAGTKDQAWSLVRQFPHELMHAEPRNAPPRDLFSE